MIESKMIGRQVKEVSMLGEDTLKFIMDSGELVTWEVEGDCCSQGLFTDILGDPTKLGEVVGVREIASMVDKYLDPKNFSDQPQLQECEQIYGVMIMGRREEAIVIHRNWSNGYYGNYFSELKDKQVD